MLRNHHPRAGQRGLGIDPVDDRQRLRQPAFLGVRADLTPADLTMADDDLGPLPTSGGEGA